MCCGAKDDSHDNSGYETRSLDSASRTNARSNINRARRSSAGQVHFVEERHRKMVPVRVGLGEAARKREVAESGTAGAGPHSP